MRVYKESRGEEVEGEVEMYKDLELTLVQEVEMEKEVVEVDVVGPSSADAS